MNGFLRIGVLPEGALPPSTAAIELGLPTAATARPPLHPGSAAAAGSPVGGRDPVSSSGDPGRARLSAVFAAAFRSVSPFMRMYSAYCKVRAPARLQPGRRIRQPVAPAALPQNYWDARDLVEAYKAKSEQFRGLLATAGGGDLAAQLIKPVQRICKYPLLFRCVRASRAPRCARATPARCSAVTS